MVTGAQKYSAGGVTDGCGEDPQNHIATKACQGHTVEMPNGWSELGWQKMSGNEIESLLLYHSTRQDHIHSITVAGLLPGSAGGGRKRRKHNELMPPEAEPWTSKNPVARLRGSISAIPIVVARQCTNEGVSFWTNPSCTVLTKEVVPPRCLVNITSAEGA